MVLAKKEIWELYDGLLYNFLYNGDINSIHILLNLYDIEANITNVYPKYRCTKEIRKKIKKLLFPRKDRQLISNNVTMLVHEDIDRLELTLYLKSYYIGFNDNKWVNLLEDEALKQYSEEELYKKNFLFHYDISKKEVNYVFNSLEEYLDNKERETKYLSDLIYSYCDKIIKKKIYNLNLFIDKQLTIDYSENPNIHEEPLVTYDQLNRIYKLLVKSIYKNMIRTHKEAYWFGLNDRVLNRYQ